MYKFRIFSKKKEILYYGQLSIKLPIRITAKNWRHGQGDNQALSLVNLQTIQCKFYYVDIVIVIVISRWDNGNELNGIYCLKRIWSYWIFAKYLEIVFIWSRHSPWPCWSLPTSCNLHSGHASQESISQGHGRGREHGHAWQKTHQESITRFSGDSSTHHSLQRNINLGRGGAISLILLLVFSQCHTPSCRTSRSKNQVI